MSTQFELQNQAYQFFIEEVPELLEAIETPLVTLQDDHSTATIHGMMRAAHSIKGGAATVGLEAIKHIAHRLEDFFKALYSADAEIDVALESLFLQAYDCLRTPLQAQIASGCHDGEKALAQALPIFEAIEEKLGTALQNIDTFIPTSADLGIDVVASIFEVDVAQGLQRLQTASGMAEAELVGELRAQMDVFSGLGELLNLPGFQSIAQTVVSALDGNCSNYRGLLATAIADLTAARHQVLQGDRHQGGAPSQRLLQWVQPQTSAQHHSSPASLAKVQTEKGQEKSAATEAKAPLLAQADLGVELDPLDLETTVLCGFGGEALEAEAFSLEPLALGADNIAATGFEALDWEMFDLESTHAPWDEPVGSIGWSHSPQANDQNSTEPEPTDAWSALNGQSHDTDLEGVTFHPVPDQQASISPSPCVPTSPLLDLDVGLDANLDANLDDIFGGDLGEGYPLTDGIWPESLSAESVGGDASRDGLMHTADLAPPRQSDLGGDQVLFDLTHPTADVIATPVGSNGNASSAGLTDVELSDIFTSLDDALQLIQTNFDQLPHVPDGQIDGVDHGSCQQPQLGESTPESKADALGTKRQAADTSKDAWGIPLEDATPRPASGLSVKVNVTRLERMDSLVGELVINRNSLSLQNEQLQHTVRDLVGRFQRFQAKIRQLQGLSDQILVAPERPRLTEPRVNRAVSSVPPNALLTSAMDAVQFDALEMDRYGALHGLLQDLLDYGTQIEESVGDIRLVAGESNRQLEQQRQMLTQLRDELMWSRMLPLSGVLNRFPRTLRDLSHAYNKPVKLTLIGAGVLVDKAVLEQLYDPLLHLLRNAFDHGIEPTEQRRQLDKPEEGQIIIRAYHQGNDTVIEVRDDGQGLDLAAIAHRAISLGLITPDQYDQLSAKRQADFIFEPGFSTASQVSDLSGRGVGLDVVKSRLQTLKGKISVTSEPHQGTQFTLRFPRTLTLAKLTVGMVKGLPIAMPSDSIEEILLPRSEQFKQSAHQQFLFWRGQLVPLYGLGDLMAYNCAVTDQHRTTPFFSKSPKSQSLNPLVIVLRREQEVMALALDQVVAEQEFVIKPLGKALTPPPYFYGCTVLGDGSLVPVIDGISLVQYATGQLPQTAVDDEGQQPTAPLLPSSASPKRASGNRLPTVLVVDDSTALRRTLALTLEKGHYRVLQAKDGRDALDQLTPTSRIDIIVCDIEMPHMNGFEFLSQRRLQPYLAAIPVIMLTSRSNDKHRRLAMQLGATHYVTKPYIEQDFLTLLKTTLQTVDQAGSPALANSLG